jgi:hypothetical protein
LATPLHSATDDDGCTEHEPKVTMSPTPPRALRS